MGIIEASNKTFDINVPVLVIGAGACGCCAALAAHDVGAEVMILERDAKPSGSTSLSGGQVPGAASHLQIKAGVNDRPDILANDLIKKAKNQNDPEMARHIAGESGTTINWLSEQHNIPFSVQNIFLYPGHSEQHMHVTPELSGGELLTCLHNAVTAKDIDVVVSAHVTDLFADADGRVVGVQIKRPDQTLETVGCQALILACNGYGGSPEMLERYMPEVAKIHYHGHVGNQGDAVNWGLELGASVSDMGSYQGFGAVVTPLMIHLTWASITEGGFQVNKYGVRFSHENQGYSEQARKVLSQEDGIAWTIMDQRVQDVAMGLQTQRDAFKLGGIKHAKNIQELADITGCDLDTLTTTLNGVAAMTRGEKDDPFGRDFSTHPALSAPYYVAKVTGALFHTQGGLDVDLNGRVLREDGAPLPNLFAGGGAARGLSGPSDWGYLSGSGLMMATTLGRLAGRKAGESIEC